jgi:hypothetical protein
MGDGEALIDTRAALDAIGLSEKHLHNDADGPADPRALQDADGPSSTSAMHDASARAEAKAWEDAEGSTDARALEDAEGPADRRALEDGEGPANRREMKDADMPDSEHSLGEHEFGSDEHAVSADAAEQAKEIDHRTSDELVEDILHEKVEEAELTPWALSVHLEQRIAKVNEMREIAKARLEALEASSKKLEKRLSSL